MFLRAYSLHLSRRTQLTRPNGVNTNYSYDSVSHLRSVAHQSGNTTLDGASYGYDDSGNRTSEINYLNGITSNYGYDAIYELLQVTQGGGTTESYTYDAVGNRLSSLSVPSYSYNASNELVATSNGSYTYDANGNTLSDPPGKSYTWDFENRLAQAVVPGTGTANFKYDPFGRRIQKSGPLGTTNYLYDGPNAIEEVDNSGNVIARYTQGKSIDEPLAQLRSGTTSYYQQDGLGSVTSLSNSAGVLAETYGYDSYGKTTTSTGTLTNPFQYTGRELDSETGIYYYRARYFDPGPGRFLSEDRLRFQQGPNFYRYAQNNSLRWVDPTGNGQTCWSVTPNGMTQVPCSGDCIQTGSNSWSCSVTPPGPPPPPSASELDEALNLLDQIDKCEREKREEIYELETEATNSSVSDLPWIPGKSLAAQVAEEVGLKIPYLDLGFFGWDIFWLGWDYNEFEQQLNNIQQSECGCKKRAK